MVRKSVRGKRQKHTNSTSCSDRVYLGCITLTEYCTFLALLQPLSLVSSFPSTPCRVRFWDRHILQGYYPQSGKVYLSLTLSSVDCPSDRSKSVPSQGPSGSQSKQVQIPPISRFFSHNCPQSYRFWSAVQKEQDQSYPSFFFGSIFFSTG